MLKSFKTELHPTQEQKSKINKTIGTCRYMYNFYLAYNKELHEKGEKFMSGKSFSVWLNNEYLPNNPDKLWIKEVSSKSVKSSRPSSSEMYRMWHQRRKCRKGTFSKSSHSSQSTSPFDSNAFSCGMGHVSKVCDGNSLTSPRK